MMDSRRRSNAGFTLIEMLVAISVFTIVMIGLLNLLDNSTRVSKIEAALADTQENVRYATYHLMRTARMMGGSILPFARGGGSGNAWAAGEVRNNVGNSQTIFGSTVDTMPGSDVLILRGFFDVAPFFIRQTDVAPGAPGTVTIREHTGPVGAERVINDLTQYATLGTDIFAGRGLVIATGEGWTQVTATQRVGGQYVVAQITTDTGVVGTSPDRTLTLTFDAHADWNVLNPNGVAVGGSDPTFRASRAGVLEAFAYYVDPQMVLRRISAQNPGAGEPVAVNIGSLQIALGVDIDGDDFLNPATEWVVSPTLVGALQGNGAVAMRISVLGRTPFEVMDWTEPAVTFAGAGDMTVPAAGSSGPRHARWRRMEVAVALRNFM
jgi:prepilin-type N-terminal cleavage/methylation domain-containing protein